MQKSFAERDLFWQGIRENKYDLFSFVQDGKKIVSTDMECQIADTQKNKDKEIVALLWHHKESRVSFQLVFYIFHDFPYLEYETFLINTSPEDSGIIEDLSMLTLHGTQEKAYYGEMNIKNWSVADSGTRIKVSYWLGSYCSGHDFLRVDRRLAPQPGENTLSLDAEHFARSSERAMPFFRMDLDDQNGYDIGVGWSGSWKADFALKCDSAPEDIRKLGKHWSLVSGMTKTRFYLKAGERLRSPGYFIGFRNGITVRDFINIHRRFMLAHHAPRNSKGELILPPLSLCSWGGVETENMKKVLQIVKDKQLPFEVHWIDAGWQGNDAPCPHFCDDSTNFVSDWMYRVGCNRINGYAHPNGMKEITDFARSCNLETLLWFEPERFHQKSGSVLFQEHPEWFLDNSSASYVFDLGNPEARQWLTGWMIDFFRKEKIEHLRQDENINFRESWRLHEEPDRIGVLEMKHIEGLYLFWGDLRKAFPDMMIDNCASGGRRLDYVLASYSFPLCQSDFETFMNYNYTCVHLENYFLNEVYPLHSTLSWMPEGDSYAIFSGGCGLGIGSKLWQFPARYPEEGVDCEVYRKHLIAIRDIRELLVRGNYYQLTKNAEDLSEFCAMQAHDREKGEGFVLVFRRPETEDAEFVCLLPEIEPDAEYEIRDFASEETSRIAGKEFYCFRKAMPEKRSVSLIFYRKL